MTLLILTSIAGLMLGPDGQPEAGAPFLLILTGATHTRIPSGQRWPAPGPVYLVPVGAAALAPVVLMLGVDMLIL
ncbi:MAG: hypothetical protein JXB47_08235 [Anaerolineae bacterium]|nr:hypothetical protein [Anaerolineae bacterium]